MRSAAQDLKLLFVELGALEAAELLTQPEYRMQHGFKYRSRYEDFKTMLLESVNEPEQARSPSPSYRSHDNY